VRARWPGLAALIPVLLATSGCGETNSSIASEAVSGQLAIYSSLPLQGPDAEVSEQIVGGEKLALAAAHGKAGPFTIHYASLDDASPTSGRWDPGVTAGDAKTAAQDTSTIAYLGDFNSGATAVSLPLMNAAGILQVSPGSPYIGLTAGLDAGQDEPNRFYPSGRRNFARIVPGDPVEAKTAVALMKTLHVRSVYVLDDEQPFDLPLAELVASDARLAGIAVTAHDSVGSTPGSVYTGAVEKVVASRAQAVFLAGDGSVTEAALWQHLHAADAKLLLLGSSAMANITFTSQIATAEGDTYLTTPVLAPSMYPRAARPILARYRSDFGGEASAYVLYGYEAMSAVLEAIDRAGIRGNNRQVVTERFLAIHARPSVLGIYSIQDNGETTLSRYGVDRVAGAHPVFFRAFGRG
jgi:branched-chain amino acid transport system substrate-binding protein